MGAAHLPGGHAGWRDRPKTLPTPNCTYTKVININKINVLIRIDKINVPNPKLNMSAAKLDGDGYDDDSNKDGGDDGDS